MAPAKIVPFPFEEKGRQPRTIGETVVVVEYNLSDEVSVFLRVKEEVIVIGRIIGPNVFDGLIGVAFVFNFL